MRLHMIRPVRRGIPAYVLVALGTATFTPASAAQDHTHSSDEQSHAGLHFSHPLFTESVSPDTKVRGNVAREWETEGKAWEYELEAEYAFHPSFSIEIGVPFVTLQPEGLTQESRMANVEALFKFANFAFADAGILLGYGLEVGIPTGNANAGIGSDHLWSVAPMLNIGYQRGRFEVVGFSLFEIPFNQREGDEVETELRYNGSALFHASPSLQGLVELNGRTVLSGEESGHTLLLLSPGVKVAPSARLPLFVGLGVSVPLSDTDLEAIGRVSVFYHF